VGKYRYLLHRVQQKEGWENPVRGLNELDQETEQTRMVAGFKNQIKPEAYAPVMEGLPLLEYRIRGVRRLEAHPETCWGTEVKTGYSLFSVRCLLQTAYYLMILGQSIVVNVLVRRWSSSRSVKAKLAKTFVAIV